MFEAYSWHTKLPDESLDVYEPYLLQIGLLKRTTRGRIVTKKAYDHLNIPYNNK